MDEAGFHAIYARYSRDVLRFALYLSGQEAQAEDLASETFLRLWSAAEPIRTETVKAFLFSIVRNLVRERLRGAPRPVELDGELADLRPGPAAQAGGRFELRAVLSALQRLPDADRAALLMRVQDGMSYEEISRVLGLSLAAVKVRIHRARLKLNELKLRQERLP